MFTGIVTDIGRVRSVDRRSGGDAVLTVETGGDVSTLAVGASVACSGVCLTAVEAAPGAFAVQVSAETRARTTAGRWRPGAPLNLERALALGDELGGHLVTGHVDGTTEILAMAPANESIAAEFALPAWLAPYVAPKGAITLDGVSLTVNDVLDDRFTVNLIPHTRKATVFGRAEPGHVVNVEIDVLARYVARALEARAAGGSA